MLFFIIIYIVFVMVKAQKCVGLGSKPEQNLVKINECKCLAFQELYLSNRITCSNNGVNNEAITRPIHGVCSLPRLPMFALTWQRAGEQPGTRRNTQHSQEPPREQPVPAMGDFITTHLVMNIFFRALSAELI